MQKPFVNSFGQVDTYSLIDLFKIYSVCAYINISLSNNGDTEKSHAQGAQNLLREIKYFVNVKTKKKDK